MATEITFTPLGKSRVRSSVALLFALLLAATYAIAARSGVPIAAVQDPKLVHLLNDLRPLEDRTQLPYSVRLAVLRDRGECNGAPSTCPEEALFVAISTIDEAPTQALYRLGDSYGWEFVSWDSFPEADVRGEHVKLKVRRKIESGDPEGAWFRNQTLVIEVNPWNAFARVEQ